jgi:hypothetical protein
MPQAGYRELCASKRLLDRGRPNSSHPRPQLVWNDLPTSSFRCCELIAAAGRMRRLDEYPDPGSSPRAPAPAVAISLESSRGTLSHIWTHIWTRIRIQPVTIFVSLSLAFGSAIILAVPPLRGPDEIAHFLRIYSYTRGELLPAAKVDGSAGTTSRFGAEMVTTARTNLQAQRRQQHDAAARS